MTWLRILSLVWVDVKVRLACRMGLGGPQYIDCPKSLVNIPEACKVVCVRKA